MDVHRGLSATRAVAKPGGGRDPLERLLDADIFVVPVAAERLVAAVAVEHHAVASAQRAREREAGERGTVGKGLVIMK